MFDKIDDHRAISMLLKDLVSRDKDLRYGLILHQIEETILLKWLEVVQKQNWWFSPVECSVRFHVNDENGTEQPGTSFTLSAKIDGSVNKDLEDYSRRVFDALKVVSLELLEKHDLDRVVFDTLDVRDSIDIDVVVE
jgi:hypothetical protein